LWRRQNRVKGALAGMAGGLAASFVMNQFQAGLAKLKPKQENNAKAQSAGEEPATVKAAERISKSVLGRTLPEDQKGPSGNLVHYLFGTAAGGVYGALAEKTPAARAGFGIFFGSVLWLLSDEIAVPALGLAKPPQKYPASTHASALASHVVYGAATELVRAGLRAL
jgi:uncharacterized membrane protein YagU involved in acid resistance